MQYPADERSVRASELVCSEAIDFDEMAEQNGDEKWPFYTGHDVVSAINALPSHHPRGIPKRFRGPSKTSARQYWVTRMHPVLYALGTNAIRTCTEPLTVLNDFRRVIECIRKRDIKIGGKKDAIVAIVKIDEIVTKFTGKPGLSDVALRMYRREMAAYSAMLADERAKLYTMPLPITWAQLQQKARDVIARDPDSIAAGMAHLYLGDIPPTRYNFHDVGWFEYPVADVAREFPDRNNYSTIDHTFYIGKHKTVLDNGPLFIPVPPGPLRDYIMRRMARGGLWMFPGQKKGTHFTHGMWSRVCNQEYGGIDLIRRAYITEFARGMSMTERAELARRMLHSISAQVEYEYARPEERAEWSEDDGEVHDNVDGPVDTFDWVDQPVPDSGADAAPTVDTIPEEEFQFDVMSMDEALMHINSVV